jgi:anti-sigma B factor antagonist
MVVEREWIAPKSVVKTCETLCGRGVAVVIARPIAGQWDRLSIQPRGTDSRTRLSVALHVENFDMVVTQSGDSAVLSVTGELDLATAPRLREELLALVSCDVCTVTVEMSGLDFIDSTGLAVLISGLKRLRQCGGDLTLQSPNSKTMKVLEITGLTRVFVIS